MTKVKSALIGFGLIILLLFILAMIWDYIPRPPQKTKYEKAQEESMEKYYQEFEKTRKRLLDDYERGLK